MINNLQNDKELTNRIIKLKNSVGKKWVKHMTPMIHQKRYVNNT